MKLIDQYEVLTSFCTTKSSFPSLKCEYLNFFRNFIILKKHKLIMIYLKLKKKKP